MNARPDPVFTVVAVVGGDAVEGFAEGVAVGVVAVGGAALLDQPVVGIVAVGGLNGVDGLIDAVTHAVVLIVGAVVAVEPSVMVSLVRR